MTVLRTWAPDDGVLGAVAPLALAVAAGSALVVDLDPDGPSYPGEGSLAQLVADGPSRADLLAPRHGVAVLRNGGVGADEAAAVVDALVDGWPRVVLRMAPTAQPSGPGVVPVVPLVPGRLLAVAGPAVCQRGPWPVEAPPGSVVLPRPRASTIRALLEGRRPGWSRWLRAWRPVWGVSWP